jgi:hypothetical protein
MACRASLDRIAGGLYRTLQSYCLEEGSERPSVDSRDQARWLPDDPPAQRRSGARLYLKWKKGRKIESIQQVKDSPGTVIVKVEGDNNTINLNNEVLRIAENKQVLEAVEGVLTPIEAKEADAIEFRQDDKPTAVLKKEDVQAIILSARAGPAELPLIEEKEKKKVVTATLHVYGPVFDPKAPNWRFLYKKKPIYADIRETSIAKDAVRRGSSFVNDRYRVRMEVTEPDMEDGTPHYKILEVLEFTPAEQQIPLPLKKGRAKKSQRSR